MALPQSVPSDERFCLRCGQPIPRTWPSGRLRTPQQYAQRKYCSVACARTPSDPNVRFWAHVDKNGPLFNGTPCWLWTAAKDRAGHGRFMITTPPTRKLIMAPRFAYELLVGPIPDGYDIDHLCRNPPCVNPLHLEAVTHAVNTQRGLNGALHVPPTHCRRGHPMNVAREKSRRVRCRKCRCIDQKRYMEKRKQVEKSARSEKSGSISPTFAQKREQP